MSVKETVKESLLGSTHSPLVSAEYRRAFDKYASHVVDGQKFMSQEDFVNAIAPANEDYHKITRDHYSILFSIADRRKDGRLSLNDWAAFENLLSKPDAEYQIVFRLFDLEGTGTVKYENFVKLHDQNRSSDALPFNWDCNWISLYVGTKGRRHDFTYDQFSQLLRGIQGEKIRQAFQSFDKNKTGYIDAEDFEKIVYQTAKHKLSDHLLHHLHTLCNVSPGSKISYAHVRAFQNVVREMDMVEGIVRSATSKTADHKITKADFLNEAAKVTRFPFFTPLEADIIFHFAGLNSTSGRLGLEDFARVLDPSWIEPTLSNIHKVPIPGVPVPGEGTGLWLTQAAQSAYKFALGSIAGAFGATMVYPIDLVKTRMQNQRSSVVGQLMYTNSIDCFKKVIRNEGFRGLYSGLGPQLIGVAPEKAIKLTVNDLVRSKSTNDKGEITLPWEIISGGTAGGCQVIFTNPLEIVKIRLQVQGEVAKSTGVPRRSALWIVKNLGLVGLYKGASACLLRDIPFSAIYFPAYAHLKKDVFGEGPGTKLGILQLLTAGAIAGMPAAYLTTPCDVIKTRLQVEARKGQTTYKGLVHCAQTVWREEGFKAFFKGGPARIMRSSPQFGFTLASYEVLQSLVKMPGAGKKETGVTEAIRVKSGLTLREQDKSLSYLRSRNALKIILDLNENFRAPRYPLLSLKNQN